MERKEEGKRAKVQNLRRYRREKEKEGEENEKFSTARKSGNISHILKAFFVRHSSENETSDSDRKIIQNLYSQMRIHMVR